MSKNTLFYTIVAIVFGGLLFSGGFILNGILDTKDKFNKSITDNASSEVTTLPIPELLEDLDSSPDKAEFLLKPQTSTTVFFPGIETKTLGYNGNILGPVIRVRDGQEVNIKIENDLDEITTVHWHGLKVSGDVDGGPHSLIQPNEIWDINFTINQPAATLWYHPHAHNLTGKQVFLGLAGLFYIEDEISDRLNIPKDYGINDFPLIIQDKRFTSTGDMLYRLNQSDIMHGFQGDTLLVNGAIKPVLEVPQGKVRFRLLNGSNGRINELAFEKNHEFWQISSDGGFLEYPVNMNKIVLSPAERAEIIIDFSNFSIGDTIKFTEQGITFMEFVVSDEEIIDSDIPQTLAQIERLSPSDATATRNFTLDGRGQNFMINGKQFEMDRIDETITLNSIEIWNITNAGMGGMGNMGNGMMGGMGGMNMAHNFHIHGTQFLALERNGNTPPVNESGWKDTILLYPGETVKIIAAFDHAGVFMYHCHILEHEDGGMMGQFEVK